MYALLDADDASHPAAAVAGDRLLAGIEAGSVDAHTHSAVLVETSALVERRLGMAALRSLHDDVVPVLLVTWVDAGLHQRAVTALLAAGRRSLSLVDWTSFQLMRHLRIDVAFAFDDDFADQGFRTWT